MIQKRMTLCGEIACARKEAGLSQQALASKVGVTREKVARFESGAGTVALLVQVMSAIPTRLLGVAKGLTIIEQLVNARAKRQWSQPELAQRCALDVRTIQQVEKGKGTVASLEQMLEHLAPRWQRQSIAKIYWDYDKARMAETDCRFTPSAFLDAVTECFGAIDLDPCWHPQSNVIAARTISLPMCGLEANWGGSDLVFVNAPFGDLATWIAKANREWEAGTIGKLLLLLPASRLDIRQFFDITASNATTLILRERLRFERLGEKSYPAPFALALACLGCSDEELVRFREHYASLVILPRNL